MRRLIIVGSLLVAGIGVQLFSARPPAAWFQRNYKDAAFEDVLRNFDRLAPRAEFYSGTGWRHFRYPFENTLQIFPGENSERIAEVRYQRWVAIPLYGKLSLTSKILYRNSALKPDYRL